MPITLGTWKWRLSDDKRDMSSHGNTEDQFVEQPASGLFEELGWTTMSYFMPHLRRKSH